MPSLSYDQVTLLITHCALERLLEKNRTLLSSLSAGGDRSIFIWSCKISGTRTGPLDLPALSNGGQFALFISMISNYMNGIPKLTQMSQITHTDTADWTQKETFSVLLSGHGTFYSIHWSLNESKEMAPRVVYYWRCSVIFNIGFTSEFSASAGLTVWLLQFSVLME